MYALTDLLFLALAVFPPGMPLLLRVFFGLGPYLFQVLRVNYELAIATTLVERLCQPDRCLLTPEPSGVPEPRPRFFCLFAEYPRYL